MLDFHNDYWTVTASIGDRLMTRRIYILGYSFYQAHDFVDNAQVAVPDGMGATENTVTASISRQLTRQVRLLVQSTLL